MSGNKRKSSSDIAGTAKKCQAITMETKVKIIGRVEQGKKMELEAQRKDEKRQEEEEVTEELKRFTTKEMAGGFSLFEEALLVLEAQDSNIGWYAKVAAAVQNAIQCYRVIYDKKNRATTQTSLDRFFKRVHRIESSKEPEPVHQRQA